MVLSSFLTVLLLCAVHVAAGADVVQRRRWTPRTLSFAAGMSVSYVFLDILPDLQQRQATVDALGILTMLDRHVYVLALVGLTISFWVEAASRMSRRQRRRAGEPDQTGRAVYRLSMASTFVQNGAIGYAIGSPGDPAVEPMWLFAVALGLHFLVNDHSLVEHHGDRYHRQGRWWLVGALLIGWAVGSIPSIGLPSAILPMVLAYVAGGTILNILRHELPGTDRSADVGAFFLGAAGYTALLLSLR
jgi:hypothetical protein